MAEQQNGIERYDFMVWPPEPLDPKIVSSADPNPETDVFCEGILYVEDLHRLQSIYASGHWLDIQDFWLEAPEPKLSNYINNDPENNKLKSRRHLAPATFAFRQAALEILSYEIGVSPSERYDVMIEDIFDRSPKKMDQRNLLINKEEIDKMAFDENSTPLPLVHSKEGRIILAKAGLQFSKKIASSNVG